MQSIVLGTDGSEGAELALRRAAEIAKACGAKVHVVTAVPDVPQLSEPIASSAKTNRVDLSHVADNVLVRAGRELDDLGVENDTYSRWGDPARVILDVADEQEADLIVVGARGLTGLQKFVLGSVSSKLSHYAHRTVMVVRDGA